MKRRKFALGLGTMAAGAVGAFGTGAFGAASIEGRKASIPVNSDSQALIGLIPNPEVSGVHNNGGELSIDLDKTGINQNSIYQFGSFVSDSGVSAEEGDLGEFPLTESGQISSRNGSGEFGSAFLIANQTENKQDIAVDYQLSTDPEEISTEFWFEVHNDGSRCDDNGLIEEPTDGKQTATTTLAAGEAIGVSLLLYAPQGAKDEEITGRLSVRAGEAVETP